MSSDRADIRRVGAFGSILVDESAKDSTWTVCTGRIILMASRNMTYYLALSGRGHGGVVRAVRRRLRQHEVAAE